MMTKNSINIYFLFLISPWLLLNCEKKFFTESDVLPATSYNFCYTKYIDQSGTHVFLGSVEEAKPKKLGKGYNPVWSPDGQYITWYSQSTINIYNVENEKIEFTIEKVADPQLPMWLPDSKRLVFLRPAYSQYGESTWMINIDGTNPVKLFDKHCYIYFYNDNYHFIYQAKSPESDDNYSLYYSNIDKSVDEIWFDVNKTGRKKIFIVDINFQNDKVLIIDDSTVPMLSMLYNKRTDKLDTLAIFKESHMTSPGAAFSHAGNFIIFSQYAGSRRYKIILKNDTNISTLLTLDPSTPYLWPKPYNILISPHDRLVLLSIFVKNPTDYFSSYYAAVYVLDLQTGKFIQLDKKGSSACCWNPLSRY